MCCTRLHRRLSFSHPQPPKHRFQYQHPDISCPQSSHSHHNFKLSHLFLPSTSRVLATTQLSSTTTTLACSFVLCLQRIASPASSFTLFNTFAPIISQLFISICSSPAPYKTPLAFRQIHSCPPIVQLLRTLSSLFLHIVLTTVCSAVAYKFFTFKACQHFAIILSHKSASNHPFSKLSYHPKQRTHLLYPAPLSQPQLQPPTNW